MRANKLNSGPSFTGGILNGTSVIVHISKPPFYVKIELKPCGDECRIIFLIQLNDSEMSVYSMFT